MVLTLKLKLNVTLFIGVAEVQHIYFLTDINYLLKFLRGLLSGGIGESFVGAIVNLYHQSMSYSLDKLGLYVQSHGLNHLLLVDKSLFWYSA
jgi:hypothetical protein